jgi:hypothetical protein
MSTNTNPTVRKLYGTISNDLFAGKHTFQINNIMNYSKEAPGYIKKILLTKSNNIIGDEIRILSILLISCGSTLFVLSILFLIL